MGFWFVADGFAIALVATELGHLLISLRPEAHRFAGVRSLRRGYRWLDRVLWFRLSQLAWMAVNFLAVRLGVWVWSMPDVSASEAMLLTGLIGLVCVALVYPVSVAWSFFIEPFSERKALGHNIAGTLSNASILRNQAAALLQEYTRVVGASGRLPSIDEVLSDVAIAQVDELAYKRAGNAQKPRWTTIFFRVGGRDFSANLKHFPVLERCIADPRIVGALYSCLEPGVVLAPHRGYFKGLLRYHLCLSVHEPHRVWLEVAHHRYHWQVGEAIMFDDMHVHSAQNLSSQPRLVLFLDVLRPLPGPLDAINAWISAYIGWHPVTHLVERRATAWAPGA